MQVSSFSMRVSDLLCMSKLAYASKLKEHEYNDDYQGSLDELLNGVENADDLLGDRGLMKELKVRLMERMLGAELTDHLGYEPGDEPTSTAEQSTTVYLGDVEIRGWGEPADQQTVIAYPHPNIRLTNDRDTLQDVCTVEVIEGEQIESCEQLHVARVTAMHRDQLNTVRAMTDADGALVRRAKFQPFGAELEAWENTPAAPAETKGWIGERYDEDAGLQYLNARYYNPKSALFIQPDWWEVTEPGVGTNRYSYSFNDPVNLSDPSGNQVTGLDENGRIVGPDTVVLLQPHMARGKLKELRGIVLHRTVSSSTASPLNTSKNTKGAVGWHILVGKDGTTIQTADFDTKVNHVGRTSTKYGNSYTIGIEVVGNYDSKTLTWEPLTPEQIDATAAAVVVLLDETGLSIDDVKPHEDLKAKTEGEGGVVWDAIKDRVNERLKDRKKERDQEEKR